MAKKKTGHVAIPFLITLLIAILAFGVAAFYFGQLRKDDIEIKKMQTSIQKPTAADTMTILFVLDENGNTASAAPEDLNGEESAETETMSKEKEREKEKLKNSSSLPMTFLIARIKPEEKKIVLLSFPENMLAVVDGRQDTLSGFYRNNGIKAVQSAINNEAGIPSDRYVILDSDAFQRICSMFGCVHYKVPINVPGFVNDSNPQKLSPAQMEKLVTYPLFEHSEIERTALTSDMIAEMLNQAGSDPETGYDNIVSSMDRNFRTLINMIETDITSVDYSNEENALKYLFKYGHEIASFRIVTGEFTSDGSNFILSSGFYDTISADFEEDAPAENSQPPEDTE